MACRRQQDVTSHSYGGMKYCTLSRAARVVSKWRLGPQKKRKAMASLKSDLCKLKPCLSIARNVSHEELNNPSLGPVQHNAAAERGVWVAACCFSFEVLTALVSVLICPWNKSGCVTVELAMYEWHSEIGLLYCVDTLQSHAQNVLQFPGVFKILHQNFTQ